MSKIGVAAFGDPTSYQGFYMAGLCRESEEIMEIGRGQSAIGVKGIIDPMDKNNKYRPKNKDDLTDKMKIQTKTQSTSFGSMSSVFAAKSGKKVEHLQISVNKDKKLFEEATDFLKKDCQNISLQKITSLKFHVNTFGLSACNWLADNMIDQMNNLNKVDFSDTVGFQRRSDCCQSIKSLLGVVKTSNIIEINISNNDLDVDGARCVSDFIKENKSLKVLNMARCRLGNKSGEILGEAINQNSKIKIEKLILGNNNIENEGLEILMPALTKMGSLQHFCFENNIVSDESLALKTLLSQVVKWKNIKTLKMNGNLGVNNCMPEFLKFVAEFKTVVSLNLSDMKLTDKNQVKHINAWAERFGKDWNVNCTLRSLILNNGFTLKNGK